MGAKRNNPKGSNPSPSPSPSPNHKPTTLKFLLDLDSRQPHTKFPPPPPPPLHNDVHHILSIITSCSQIYTFFTHPSQIESPQHLLNLLSIINNSFQTPSPSPPPQQILSPLFTMISANLFRPLPTPPLLTPTPAVFLLDDHEDHGSTPAAATCPPHLTILYDILLQLVVNLEAKALAPHYINDSFIIRLLALFRSQDTRERENLKNLCHKIYSKFHSLRSSMRQAMKHVFLDYIFETTTDEKQQHYCFGIGDLLEIWGTIINGFSVPLKEEHKHFLTKILIPLHRPRDMQAYHKQLAYCIYQFVEKEAMLGVVVIRSILRYWPKTNCEKEVLLIREVEELVEKMGSEQYRIVALPLCKQIIKCFNSCNLQVAERAHYVWNKERFVKMMTLASEEEHLVFQVIVEGIEKNLREHWSANVRQVTQNVKEMIEGMEPQLYAKHLLQLHGTTQDQEERRRKKKWERVEMAAYINQFIRDLQQQQTPSSSTSATIT